MDFIVPMATQALLPVTGGNAVFPVRRVYCVGQNYASHVAEIGGDSRQPPFFFSKPPDALVPGGGKIAYPPRTSNLQHEVELVVALLDGGADIPVEQALARVFGYAVGIDLTRRDLQSQAKEKGRPWEMSKAFDQSGPIGTLTPATQCGHLTAGCVWLTVNGDTRQDDDIGQMIWNVAEVIANLSTYVTLAAGDLIFTGTPSGVSTVTRGDLIECGIDGVGCLTIELV
ncbi:MAG: fumarylacetoacetate hydrolase family protein [Candidatus Accumulibacter sp.]|jgi:fumarylpyruvate hydrolase|nr:fumarylacetoacetate hydrolase family protein [Accumulibacter sp.]